MNLQWEKHIACTVIWLVDMDEGSFGSGYITEAKRLIKIAMSLVNYLLA